MSNSDKNVYCILGTFESTEATLEVWRMVCDWSDIKMVSSYDDWSEKLEYYWGMSIWEIISSKVEAHFDISDSVKSEATVILIDLFL